MTFPEDERADVGYWRAERWSLSNMGGGHGGAGFMYIFIRGFQDTLERGAYQVWMTVHEMSYTGITNDSFDDILLLEQDCAVPMYVYMLVNI